MRRSENAEQQRSTLAANKRVRSEHCKANHRRLYKENTEDMNMVRALTEARDLNSREVVKCQNHLFLRRRDAIRRKAQYDRAMRLRKKRTAQHEKAMRLLAKAGNIQDEAKIIVLRRNKDIAEWLMDDITKYNQHRKSIRPDEVFWPYDLPWAQTMGHFPHPCLLIHHVHGLGLAQMVHALPRAPCPCDIFSSPPLYKQHPLSGLRTALGSL